jgi:uncharacterized protein (TIGR00251 family)
VIALSETAAGCILPVRAQPGARRTGIVGEHGGALKIAVQAPPQDGRANKALVDILRSLLKLKRSQIDLVSGESSRDKRFLIEGLSKSELASRLAELL